MKVIYKHYDQESLDIQFNNRLHVPDYTSYFSRWELLSRETEQKLSLIKDLRYGNLERERLDIYPSLQCQSKTLIFLHGGYWHLLDKSLFHFIANGFHAYGITTVLLTYPYAPDASIDQIVLSCRNAMEWLYNNLSAFNGDPHQMYLAGHSAGGHLAAMLMATNWKLFNSRFSNDFFKGVCMVSGLFNLVPIQLSYLNKILKIDKESAERNSPLSLKPLITCPLIVAVGEAETQEFNDQSLIFHSYWKSEGIDSQLLQLAGENHFSIAESIADSQSSLHKALLQLMKVE